MKFFSRLWSFGVLGVLVTGLCFSSVFPDGSEKRDNKYLYERGLEAVQEMIASKKELLEEDCKGVVLCEARLDFWRHGVDTIKMLLEERRKLLIECQELQERYDTLQAECEEWKDECSYVADERDELQEKLSSIDVDRMRSEVKRLKSIIKDIEGTFGTYDDSLAWGDVRFHTKEIVKRIGSEKDKVKELEATIKGAEQVFSEYDDSLASGDLSSRAREVVKRLEELEAMYSFNQKNYVSIHRSGLALGIVVSLAVLAMIGAGIGLAVFAK